MQKILFFFLVLLSFWNTLKAQSDTTEINQSGYFLTFVKKVYLNPTVYLRTQDFKENTNLSFVALPDLSSDKTNASSGFEKGLQKVLRFLMQSDGGVRFYFNPDSTTHPFRFWYSDNLHCKFKQADKDSIDYYLNHNFADGNISMTNALRFETTIDKALDYIEKCITANPQACGEEPQNETTEINTKPLSVSLHNRVNSKYDIDVKQYEKLESHYAKAFDIHTQQDWYAPAKLLVSNETAEPVALAIHSNEGDFLKQNIKIEILKTHALLPIDQASTEDSLFFSLPSSLPPGDPVEVIVKYKSPKDSNTYTVGFFMVNAMEREVKNLVLIPANGFVISANFKDSVETELEKIYGQASVDFNVTIETGLAFPNEYPTTIDIESSGLFSNYAPDLRDYVGEVQDMPNYDEDNYYLVVGLETTELQGYMPRARNIGFIFKSVVNKPKVIAHEIGHGAFHFRHIFAEEELGEEEQGQTNNIMDYVVNPKDLYLHQWNFIKDPAFVSWFGGDDEEGESISYALNSELLKKFRNNDSSYTFLSPTGKPITVPKETITVEFATADDYWVSLVDNKIQEGSYFPLGSLITFNVKINGVIRNYKSRGSNTSDAGGEFDGYVAKFKDEKGIEKEQYYIDSLTFKLKNIQTNLYPILGTPVFSSQSSNFELFFSRSNLKVVYSDIKKNNKADGQLLKPNELLFNFDYSKIEDGVTVTPSISKPISAETYLMLKSFFFGNKFEEVFKTLSSEKRSKFKEHHPEIEKILNDESSIQRTKVYGWLAYYMYAIGRLVDETQILSQCIAQQSEVVHDVIIKQLIYDDSEKFLEYSWEEVFNNDLEKLVNEPTSWKNYESYLNHKLDYEKKNGLFSTRFMLTGSNEIGPGIGQVIPADIYNIEIRFYQYKAKYFLEYLQKLLIMLNNAHRENLYAANGVSVSEVEFILDYYQKLWFRESESHEFTNCLVKSFTCKERIALLRTLVLQHTGNDWKETLIKELFTSLPQSDYSEFYEGLCKEYDGRKYDLFLWVIKDLNFGNYDGFAQVMTHFMMNHAKELGINSENLKTIDLYHDGAWPLDSENEYEFNANGIQIKAQPIVGAETHLYNLKPDELVLFDVKEDMHFNAPDGQAIQEGDKIIAPAFWAYYVLGKNATRTNTIIATFIGEVILITVTAGTATPGIMAFEVGTAVVSFGLNVASDELPFNETLPKIATAFDILSAITIVGISSSAMSSTGWLSKSVIGGKPVYRFVRNNFSKVKKLFTNKGSSSEFVAKLDDFIAIIKNEIKIHPSNIQKTQYLNDLLKYLENCKTEAKLTDAFNQATKFEFIVDNNQLFVKALSQETGLPIGYQIKIGDNLISNGSKFEITALEVWKQSDGSIIKRYPFESISTNEKVINLAITSKGKLVLEVLSTTGPLIRKIETLELTNLLAKFNLLDNTIKVKFIDDFVGASDEALIMLDNNPSLLDYWKTNGLSIKSKAYPNVGHKLWDVSKSAILTKADPTEMKILEAIEDALPPNPNSEKVMAGAYSPDLANSNVVIKYNSNNFNISSLEPELKIHLEYLQLIKNDFDKGGKLFEKLYSNVPSIKMATANSPGIHAEVLATNEVIKQLKFAGKFNGIQDLNKIHVLVKGKVSSRGFENMCRCPHCFQIIDGVNIIGNQ